ncbi:cytochrome P450 [Thozetella sp. PMI_491]|nr:cytochrome P450 [Thozetella sp. PMI_491]
MFDLLAATVVTQRALALSAALLIIGTLLLINKLQRTTCNHPPGPSGLPILGNAFQISRFPWLQFTLWKEEYGPVVYLNALGRPIIVLNTLEAAIELLDRQAVSTSDRPRFPLANRMTGGQFLPFINSHTHIWRHTRRAYQEGFRATKIAELEPDICRESAVLCTGMLTKSLLSDPYGCFQRYVASTGLSVVYGQSSPSHTSINPVWVMLSHSITRMTQAAMSSTHLVEIFPWMDRIPSRFSTWKRKAEKIFLADSALVEDLLGKRRNSAVSGSSDRVADAILAAMEKGTLSDKEGSWAAFSLYAGMQTTAGVLNWALFALVLHPDIQRQAQEELDQVVGHDRLPRFSDFDSLPYIQALVREVLRWRPVVPLGLPHSTSSDLQYCGYLIPKDTTLLPNIWAINRDTSIYGPDATEFRPSRHLDPETGRLRAAVAGVKEEGHVSFGFGRRVCPGRGFGNKLLFISLATMLWALKIERETGLDGEPLPLDVDGCIDDGVVVRPRPFKCIIHPRFPDAIHVLQMAMEYL